MYATNATVILFTPFHLTNNFLLFFSRLCFLRFFIWLLRKPESLFTESDIVTAVANTPITMLHIGQLILVYYTTNHLISQSKKHFAISENYMISANANCENVLHKLCTFCILPFYCSNMSAGLFIYFFILTSVQKNLPIHQFLCFLNQINNQQLYLPNHYPIF